MLAGWKEEGGREGGEPGVTCMGRGAVWPSGVLWESWQGPSWVGAGVQQSWGWGGPIMLRPIRGPGASPSVPRVGLPPILKSSCYILHSSQHSSLVFLPSDAPRRFPEVRIKKKKKRAQTK